MLKIETLDDLWHLYNVVGPGDIIISRTSRRVKIGDEDSRKQDSVRKIMMLKLKLEDVSFRTFSKRVRIKGKILEGPSDLVNIAGVAPTILRGHECRRAASRRCRRNGPAWPGRFRCPPRPGRAP